MQKKMKNPAADQAEQPPVQPEKRNTVVKIEPESRRSKPKRRSPEIKRRSRRRIDIEAVAGHGLMTLAVAGATAWYNLSELKGRRKMRQCLLMMAGAMMVLLGTFKMALMLMNH